MKTATNDVVLAHPAVALTGRVMFTRIFFLSGITHFTRVSPCPWGGTSASPWNNKKTRSKSRGSRS